jgi:hypothetical protein
LVVPVVFCEGSPNGVEVGAFPTVPPPVPLGMVLLVVFGIGMSGGLLPPGRALDPFGLIGPLGMVLLVVFGMGMSGGLLPGTALDPFGLLGV